MLYIFKIVSVLTFLKIESENRNYFENIQHTSFTCIFIRVRKLDPNRKGLCSVTSHRHEEWALEMCGSVNKHTENMSK